MRRKILYGFAISALLAGGLFPRAACAYRDEILTTSDEIWKAARAALTEPKIQKADWNSKKIQSRWIEDYVTKQKEIFPSKLGFNKTIPSTVRRRYRMTIELKETTGGTEVLIRGDFQERPFSGVPSRLHWEKVSPSTEDFETERALFFQIIGELEKLRAARPS